MKKGTQKIPTQTERRQSQRRSGTKGGFQRKRNKDMSDLFDTFFKPLRPQ